MRLARSATSAMRKPQTLKRAPIVKHERTNCTLITRLSSPSLPSLLTNTTHPSAIASAVYVISIIEWRFLRSHCTLARSREARHQALNDTTAAYRKTSEIIDLRGTNTNVIEQIVDGDIDDGDIEEGSLAL